MSRYFIEVSYRGTAYAGFQVQHNANTVQAEVEKALEVLFREKFTLTGSSRTDTGVHALQNYFHFDFSGEIGQEKIYNINSLLPGDIALKSVRKMREGAHCRFDAQWRQYAYTIYARKDPFIAERAYYFPYTLDFAAMESVAKVIMEYKDFKAFSKRNSQVKTYTCRIMESGWVDEGEVKVYRVRANRFLRGMVRGLVGTMLQVGRGAMDEKKFREIIEGGKQDEVDFAVPGRGLCLERVELGEGYFG